MPTITDVVAHRNKVLGRRRGTSPQDVDNELSESLSAFFASRKSAQSYFDGTAAEQEKIDDDKLKKQRNEPENEREFDDFVDVQGRDAGAATDDADGVDVDERTKHLLELAAGNGGIDVKAVDRVKRMLRERGFDSAEYAKAASRMQQGHGDKALDAFRDDVDTDLDDVKSDETPPEPELENYLGKLSMGKLVKMGRRVLDKDERDWDGNSYGAPWDGRLVQNRMTTWESLSEEADDVSADLGVEVQNEIFNRLSPAQMRGEYREAEPHEPVDNEGELLVCPYCTKDAPDIHPMNMGLYARYVDNRGMILRRTATGLCPRHQRKVARAIKRGHHLGIISHKHSMFTINNPFDEPEPAAVTRGITCADLPENIGEHLIARRNRIIRRNDGKPPTEEDRRVEETDARAKAEYTTDSDEFRERFLAPRKPRRRQQQY
jgi:ribosomal protein S18